MEGAAAGAAARRIRMSAALFSIQGCAERPVTWSTSLFFVTQFVRMCGHFPRSSTTTMRPVGTLNCRRSWRIRAAGALPLTTSPATPAIGAAPDAVF